MIFLTLVLYLCAVTTVLLTAHVPGFEFALKAMTKESGFFEWASVLLLFAIAATGLSALAVNSSAFQGRRRLALLLFSLLAFLGALEELSWGQHLVGFESAEIFKEHNLQQETNLHNFIPPAFFSSLIYTSVYTVFVFLPLGALLLTPLSKTLGQLEPWLPNLHTVLIVLFGASFQIYFYDDIGAKFDMATLLTALVLFLLVVSLRRKWSRWLLIHFCWVLGVTGLMMYSYKAFDFFNMQYEIREVFVVLATLVFMRQLIGKVMLEPARIT